MRGSVLLFVIRCALFVVCCLFLVVVRFVLWFVVVVGCLSFCLLLPGACCCLLFVVVRCLLFVFCVLFVVSCAVRVAR